MLSLETKKNIHNKMLKKCKKNVSTVSSIRETRF